MYRCDIPRLPTQIHRRQFVKHVFDLGWHYSHSYENIVAAVEIGDKFVSFFGPRIPIIDEEDDSGVMTAVVPQVYSVELAHVCTIIVAKAHEDEGSYNNIRTAVNAMENFYIYKMEWEICNVLGFSVSNRNFMTAFGYFLFPLTMTRHITLSPMFWDVGRSICLHRSLSQAHPLAVFLAVILLYKRGKLSAVREYKYRRFCSLMSTLAHEFEIPLIDMIHAYIKLKTHN